MIQRKRATGWPDGFEASIRDPCLNPMHLLSLDDLLHTEPTCPQGSSSAQLRWVPQNDRNNLRGVRHTDLVISPLGFINRINAIGNTIRS